MNDNPTALPRVMLSNFLAGEGLSSRHDGRGETSKKARMKEENEARLGLGQLLPDSRTRGTRTRSRRREESGRTVRPSQGLELTMTVNNSLAVSSALTGFTITRPDCVPCGRAWLVLRVDIYIFKKNKEYRALSDIYIITIPLPFVVEQRR